MSSDEESANAPKWFNSPVSIYEGTVVEIRARIPVFIRQPFGLVQPDSDDLCFNENLDTIVRCPTASDSSFVPVGVVSNGYALLQHYSVLDESVSALKNAGIAVSQISAMLRITKFGERMELTLRFPEAYSFDPGDDHPMALQLVCLNSVDGSTRFRALMGWYRFVCSNGLVVGVTRSDIRRRHSNEVDLADIGEVVASGVQEYEAELRRFSEWRRVDVELSAIKTWVDGAVCQQLGFKAAARAFHIARTGCDASVVGNYKDRTPSTIGVKSSARVPGAPSTSRSLYDLSQVLAWLATQRRDVQEQLAWREKIAVIMGSLGQ